MMKTTDLNSLLLGRTYLNFGVKRGSMFGCSVIAACSLFWGGVLDASAAADTRTMAADASVVYSPSSQSVTLTATVSPTDNLSPAIDEGTVTFTLRLRNKATGNLTLI